MGLVRRKPLTCQRSYIWYVYKGGQTTLILGLKSPLLYVRQVKEVVVDNVVNNEGRRVVGSVFRLQSQQTKKTRVLLLLPRDYCVGHSEYEKCVCLWHFQKILSDDQHKRSNVMLKGRYPKLLLGVCPSAFSNKYQKWWFSKQVLVTKNFLRIKSS